MEVDHFDQLTNETQERTPDTPMPILAPASPKRSQDQQPITPRGTEFTTQKSRTETLPPLPDSPTQDDDATWLKRQTNASIAFTEKAKTLLNPYRTANETMKANRKSSLNAKSTPMSVQLTTLSSSRSDIASRGRED